MENNLSSFVKRIRDIMWKDPGINGDAQRIEQLSWMLFLRVYDAKENDWMMSNRNYQSIIPEELRWRNWAHDDGTGNILTGDELLDFVNYKLFPKLKALQVTPDTPIKQSIVKTTFEEANQYMKDGVLLRQVLNIVDSVELTNYENIHAFGDIYESILKEIQNAGSAGEFYTPRAVTDFMAKKINPQVGEKMADFACGTGGFLASWLKELKPKLQSSSDQKKYDNSIYGIEKKQFPYMLCITNMLLHDVETPQVFHDNSLTKDVLDYTEKDKFDVILMNPPFGGTEKNEVKGHFPSDLASSETYDLFMDVIMYRLKDSGRCAVVLPDGFLFGVDGAKLNIKKKLINEFNLHTIIRLPGSVFAPYTPTHTNILFFDNNGKTKNIWYYRMDMPEGYKHFSKTKPIELKHFDCVNEWWKNRKEIKDEKLDETQTETWKSRKYSYKEITEDYGYDLDLCGYPKEEKILLSPEETIDEYVLEKENIENRINEQLDKIKKLLKEN